MKPVQAKKFNAQQRADYAAYCDKCRANNVTPEPQSRYFPEIKVNYGYVIANRFGEVHWRKNKRSFS